VPRETQQGSTACDSTGGKVQGMGNVNSAAHPSAYRPPKLNIAMIDGHRQAEWAAQRRLYDHMKDAGAGWYFDPHDRATYRYWDGAAWTSHCSDIPNAAAPF